MPYTVAVSFDKFIEKIALTGKRASTAQDRADNVVTLLKDSFTILETIPTGSLVHGTALKGSADADVVVALHYGKHIKDKTPKRVLEDVRTCLSEYDARLVKKNGQAVTLYFTSWPNVDIVPASRVVDEDGNVTHFSIPDANRGIWISTNPKKHDGQMDRLSDKALQLVQMVKCWNRAHSSYLQSFHIDVLVLKNSYVGEWPWAVYQFFKNALDSIDMPLYHPASGPGRVDDYLSVSDRRELKARLTRANDLAYDAWWAVVGANKDHEKAIGCYRIIFGSDFPAYG